MLRVKKLNANAVLPTIAHAGEDLGYDLYALEETWLYRDQMVKVHTGIVAVAYWFGEIGPVPLGLIVKDRSSMTSKGVFTHGGVIDAGYRGELIVNMTTHNHIPYHIIPGAKIAQAVPVHILTGPITEVQELPESKRGEKGFGSSGV